VEIEAFATANLVAKMETGLLVPAPVWTNLKTFPMESFRGVDFITAGYPCQPFSCAGQRKGTDDPRHLWPYIRRIYQTIHPRWMFFENVEGHVTLGLSTVISDLEEDGYRVKSGLFTAAEVGAPHRRKRVFILANRIGIDRRTQTEGRIDDRQAGSAGEELAHSSRVGRRGWNQSGGEIRECGMPEDKIEGPGSSSEVLANANEQRSQGRNSGIMSERAIQWPARPGSTQYDWEEPRVVESGMGRAVNGSSSRVDRLRLLGNGVVPQQAARAYTILNKRMKEI
jgi:DNA (cytosine-5)-methyltransferase 1